MEDRLKRKEETIRAKIKVQRVDTEQNQLFQVLITGTVSDKGVFYTII